MKALVFLFTFSLLTTSLNAGGAYRNYLLSKVYTIHTTVQYHDVGSNPGISSAAFIPRFETPKGAIFCRMEDKVTKATKVWLKLGIQ